MSSRKYFLTKKNEQDIENLYLNCLLSYRDIAKQLFIPLSTVHYYLKKHNLFRTHTEALKVNRLKPKKHRKDSKRFKGILIHNAGGYLLRYLELNDQYYCMANHRHYILEHRYIMAKHLRRCLLKSEIVHHKNNIRDDNRIENLELISLSNHNLRTKYCGNCGLKREMRLIQFQNKELLEQIRQLNLNLIKC